MNDFAEKRQKTSWFLRQDHMFNSTSAASHKALTVSLEAYNSQCVNLCSGVQSNPVNKK